MPREPKKVILFDVYQTLTDIDINDENKKRNQANAWEHLAKSFGEYGVKIKSAELIELNKNQQENFYIGKDKKIQHHNFCKILGMLYEIQYLKCKQNKKKIFLFPTLSVQI